MKLSLVLSVQPSRFRAVALEGALAANIRQIAELGYEGVELAVRDPSLVDLTELEALLVYHGLQVPAIGTGQLWGEEGLSFADPEPSVRRRAIDRVREHIRLATRWRAAVIIGLVRGTIQPGVEPEQAREWLVQALVQSCAAASDEGVCLCLEPINRYETSLINTVAEGLSLLEAVAAPNLGLLLDTFHMNIEEPQIEESIRRAGGYIFHFHVADSNRRYPGAGHLNFDSILGVLRESGYQRWVSGEFEPLPDSETAAKEAICYLRSLVRRA